MCRGVPRCVGDGGSGRGCSENAAAVGWILRSGDERTLPGLSVRPRLQASELKPRRGARAWLSGDLLPIPPTISAFFLFVCLFLPGDVMSRIRAGHMAAYRCALNSLLDVIYTR